MTDVCLILEGTYPFVSGGVSTWIHQLINSMRDVQFSILSIFPFENPHREYKYKLPSNLLDIQDVFLHDARDLGRMSPAPQRRRNIELLGTTMTAMMDGDLDAFGRGIPALRDPKSGLNMTDALQSPEAWAFLQKAYEEYAQDVSFLDYFWTCRSMVVPLVNTVQAVLPPARLYHVVSTGYAGLIASIAKSQGEAGVLLTEHGVYTHERLLEISQATWIYTPHRERFRVQRELSYFKRLWLGFFQMLGNLTYNNVDRIVTLYEGNRIKQMAAGAPAEKISIIPNGIDIERYTELERRPQSARRKTVAFIGRIVNIKDVKTLVQAAKIVQRTNPGIEFVLLGPTDEERDYTQECRDLVRSLKLESMVRFLGKVEMFEWYPKIDLVVLTSLSEAQPYVLLEAGAVGIPVVATDVGACRELLEGRTLEDQELGPSGLLTRVAHPEETAEAILRILNDPDLWKNMSEAARARIRTYYDQNDLISKYLNLYEQMMR